MNAGNRTGITNRGHDARRSICAGIAALCIALLALTWTHWLALADAGHHSEHESDVARLETGLASTGGIRTNHAATRPSERERFATQVAAVIAAANHYNPLSIVEDREYMGAILQDGDGYLYTVGAGQRGWDKVTVKIQITAGLGLVALWHTHGAPAPERKYFSKVDTRLAEKLQLPYYLADFTGRLKVFQPGGRTLSAMRARRLGLPAVSGIARGREVVDERGACVRVRIDG